MTSDPSIKEQLRDRLRAQMVLHEKQIPLESQQLRSQIHAQPAWKRSHAILFFSPIGHEPDLMPLAVTALNEGKLVAFLRFLNETSTYRPYQVRDLKADLAPGRVGISEPGLSCPQCDLNALDLIFVPGLGFSLDGARLGRGKGHYDRLLAGVSATKCGVGFDWQVTADLPREAHDVRLDCLATPSGWREFGNQPLK